MLRVEFAKARKKNIIINIILEIKKLQIYIELCNWLALHTTTAGVGNSRETTKKSYTTDQSLE